MADTYEQNLGQKASLTTNDFIRVVGSDNVSYKQPMTDLMITTGIARTWIATGVDLNTLTPNDTSGNGYYRGNNISTMTNRPSAEINDFPWALNAIKVNSYIKQILHVYTAQANIVVYERIQRYSSGSTVWGNWEKMPTRAEVDALNSKSQKIVSNNTSITLSLSASSVYLLVLLNDGGSSQYRNVSVISTGANSGTILPLADSAQITTSLSGLSLAITRTVYASGVLYKLA